MPITFPDGTEFPSISEITSDPEYIALPEQDRMAAQDRYAKALNDLGRRNYSDWQPSFGIDAVAEGFGRKSPEQGMLRGLVAEIADIGRRGYAQGRQQEAALALTGAQRTAERMAREVAPGQRVQALDQFAQEVATPIAEKIQKSSETLNRLDPSWTPGAQNVIYNLGKVAAESVINTASRDNWLGALKFFQGKTFAPIHIGLDALTSEGGGKIVEELQKAGYDPSNPEHVKTLITGVRDQLENEKYGYKKDIKEGTNAAELFGNDRRAYGEGGKVIDPQILAETKSAQSSGLLKAIPIALLETALGFALAPAGDAISEATKRVAAKGLQKPIRLAGMSIAKGTPLEATAARVLGEGALEGVAGMAGEAAGQLMSDREISSVEDVLIEGAAPFSQTAGVEIGRAMEGGARREAKAFAEPLQDRAKFIINRANQQEQATAEAAPTTEPAAPTTQYVEPSGVQPMRQVLEQAQKEVATERLAAKQEQEAQIEQASATIEAHMNRFEELRNAAPDTAAFDQATRPMLERMVSSMENLDTEGSSRALNEIAATARRMVVEPQRQAEQQARQERTQEKLSRRELKKQRRLQRQERLAQQREQSAQQESDFRVMEELLAEERAARQNAPQATQTAQETQQAQTQPTTPVNTAGFVTEPVAQVQAQVDAVQQGTKQAVAIPVEQAQQLELFDLSQETVTDPQTGAQVIVAAKDPSIPRKASRRAKKVGMKQATGEALGYVNPQATTTPQPTDVVVQQKDAVGNILQEQVVAPEQVSAVPEIPGTTKTVTTVEQSLAERQQPQAAPSPTPAPTQAPQRSTVEMVNERNRLAGMLRNERIPVAKREQIQAQVNQLDAQIKQSEAKPSAPRKPKRRGERGAVLIGDRRKAKSTVDIPTQEGGGLPTATWETLYSNGYAPEDSSGTQIPSTFSTYEKILSRFGKAGMRVLDFSAGLGYGTVAMRRVGERDGIDIEGYEPFSNPSKRAVAPEYEGIESYKSIPKNSYDIVVNNAVLNVVPESTGREILSQIYDVLKPGGSAFINVMGWNNIKSRLDNPKTKLVGPREIITQRGTFQKGYTPETLLRLIRETLPTAQIERTQYGDIGFMVTKPGASIPRKPKRRGERGAVLAGKPTKAEAVTPTGNSVIDEAFPEQAPKGLIEGGKKLGVSAWAGTKVAGSNQYEKFVLGMNKAVVPIKNRLRKISPRLYSTMMRTFFDSSRHSQESVSKQMKLAEKIQKLRPENQERFNALMIDGNAEAAYKLAAKHGFLNEYIDSRIAIEVDFERAWEAGMEVHDVTSIRDKNGFIKPGMILEKGKDGKETWKRNLTLDEKIEAIKKGRVVYEYWARDIKDYKELMRLLGDEYRNDLEAMFGKEEKKRFRELLERAKNKKRAEINKGITKAARAELKEQNKEAREAGFKVATGERAETLRAKGFKVVDPKEVYGDIKDFLRAQANYEQETRLTDAEIEEIRGKAKLTDTEREEAIASWIRGYSDKKLSVHTNNFFQPRVWKTISDLRIKTDATHADVYAQYAPAHLAQINFTRRLHEAIAMRKALGLTKNGVNADLLNDPYLEGEDLIRESLPRILNEMVKSDKSITDSELMQVRSMLMAYFNNKGLSGFFANYLKAEKMVALMSFMSSLSQIADLLYAAARYGSPIAATVETGRAFLEGVIEALPLDEKSKDNMLAKIGAADNINLVDIGADDIVLHELVDPGKNFSDKVMNSVIDSGLKGVGFKFADRLGKRVFIRTALKKFSAQAKSAQKTGKAPGGTLGMLLKDGFTQEEQTALLDKLAKWDGDILTISDEMKLLMFLELSEVQAISPLNMPENYLASGIGGRMLYTLKSFMLNRIADIITQATRRDADAGTLRKFGNVAMAVSAAVGPELVINAIRNVASGQWRTWEDFEDEWDSFIATILMRFVGISPYSFKVFKDQNLGNALLTIAGPPTMIASGAKDIAMDAFDVAFKGKDIGEALEENRGVRVGAKMLASVSRWSSFVAGAAELADRWSGMGKERYDKKVKEYQYRPATDWLGNPKGKVEYLLELFGSDEPPKKNRLDRSDAKYTVDKVSHTMTPEMFQEYNRLAGVYTAQALRENGLPRVWSEDVHERIVKPSRALAREQVLASVRGGGSSRSSRRPSSRSSSRRPSRRN